MDLLKDLHEEIITLDQANDIYDALGDLAIVAEAYPKQGVYHAIGLSHTEATAFLHGVDFAELATWRYKGWPRRCPVCGRRIVPERFGWFAWEDVNDPDRHVLLHIQPCLNMYGKKRGRPSRTVGDASGAKRRKQTSSSASARGRLTRRRGRSAGSRKS